jgi:flagellar basal body-associated protein FliL
MNYFTKKNIVIVSIAVLLIVNIAAISTVLFLAYKKPAMPEIQPRESINTARKKINLSADQKSAFEGFQKKYQQQTRNVFIKMHQKRVRMMDEFSKEDPDSILLYDLAKKTGELHEELKVLTINHLLDLKGICSEKQFKYLEGMFRQKIMDDESGMHRPFNNQRKYRNRRNIQPKRGR